MTATPFDAFLHTLSAWSAEEAQAHKGGSHSGFSPTATPVFPRGASVRLTATPFINGYVREYNPDGTINIITQAGEYGDVFPHELELV